ncbi:MAG: DUF5320 domain-containing protein [Gudongella sp.]|nr:DUF5320 domain-containing protein [Gudongella sp.]
MPRYDMTGPMGRGQMTGRGMGYCVRRFAPGMMQGYGRGAGYGRGMGFRRGFGRMFWSYDSDPYYDTDEKEFLEDEISWLEEELKAAKDALARRKSQED